MTTKTEHAPETELAKAAKPVKDCAALRLTGTAYTQGANYPPWLNLFLYWCY